MIAAPEICRKRLDVAMAWELARRGLLFARPNIYGCMAQLVGQC